MKLGGIFMNCIKRGWLYTTRKKGKSFLLFCILFLIAVFVLSALAIDKASSLAQDNLRKSLGENLQSDMIIRKLTLI